MATDQVTITEQDLLKIISEQINFGKHSKAHKAMNNMFYNNTNIQNQEEASQVSGEESIFTGVHTNARSNVQIRQCTRIWSGFTKFIRSQCNKDRVCDSIYFGSFVRRPIDAGETKQQGKYALINDSQKMESLNLIPGQDAFLSTPSFADGKQSVSINLKSIGQVCSTTGELVHQVIYRVRELALQLSQQKNKTVQLNLIIGTLYLHPNKTAEFRSINQASQTINKTITLDAINQNLHNSSLLSKDDKIRSLLKTADQDGNGHVALSSFLQNKIHRGKSEVSGGSRNDDAISSISKKNKWNNKLIEQAAKEVEQRRTKQNNNSESKLEKIQSHQKAFFNQATTPNAGGRKTFNQLIESNRGNNLQGFSQTKSQMSQSIVTKKSFMSKRLSKGNQSRGAMSVRVSEKNFRNTQDMAKYKTQTSLGEDDIFAARTQKVQNKSKFDKIDRLNSQQSGKRFNYTQVTNHVQHQKELEKIIGGALDRKQISDNFHSGAYPYFFKSQGPFKVYDHATAKGQRYVSNVQTTNDQAANRFQNECDKIKEVREFEREQFDWQKKKQDIIQSHNQQMRQNNNLDNLRYLAQQIEQDRNKKFETELIERQYYKPHFGPEETDETTMKELQKQHFTKNFMNTQLTHQISKKNKNSQRNWKKERDGDLQNLKECQNMFIAEERALMAKNMKDKLTNKMNWESQMQDRQLRKTMDELFY